MSTGLIVAIVILIILVGAAVALYFFGKKAQAKQNDMQEQIEATKQSVSMLVIDKKRLRIKDSGLPEIVAKQMPWYSRFNKLPIVKAKVGPQIMTLLCDERIFDSIPVKKEIKAQVSGIYISNFKELHGRNLPKEPVKKSFFKNLLDKAREKAGAGQMK